VRLASRRVARLASSVLLLARPSRNALLRGRRLASRRRPSLPPSFPPFLPPAAVERHSSLYETAPAYVADQPVFLNAAFVARVDDPDVGADPIKLLDALKRVERELGRVDGGVRFGPRPIDLDIIFHGGGAVNRERLTVPHPRYRERGFVLPPLADLDVDLDADSDADDSDADAAAAAADADATSSSSSSSSDRVISRSLRTARAIWSAAGGERNVGGDEMRRVMPLRDGLWSWKDDDAAVMGVLNVTPDSFSDGGALNTRVNRNGDDVDVTSKSAVDLDAVVRAARRMADDGAMFLDVGGQSTRPGATRVSGASS